MSIDINSIQSIYSSSNVGAIASNPDGSAGASQISSGAAYSVDMSQPGQLFSQLQSLAQSDPARFKEVTADIAAQLKDAASSDSGNQADVLNNLAARFQAASQSGNMSDLAPPARQQGAQAGGHHHHHHHAQQVANGSSQASGTETGNESVFQVVQSIIASALNSASPG